MQQKTALPMLVSKALVRPQTTHIKKKLQIESIQKGKAWPLGET